MLNLSHKEMRANIRNEMREERADLLRRLRAAGVPLPFYEDHEDGRACGLRIRQFGAEILSTAFDLGYCGTGYTIAARITINRPAFAISHFGLQLPWENSYVWWLEDPVETGARWNRYWFPANGPNFDRSEVINHHADVRRMLPRGKTLEGLLLGVGDAPIPDHFVHGNTVPAFVTVTDQYDRDYSGPVSLRVDRTQTLLRRTRKEAPRKGLLDSPDREPGRAPLPESGRPVKR